MTRYMFNVPWGLYSKGDVIEPEGVFREMLLNSNTIRIVGDTDTSTIETSMVDPVENASIRRKTPRDMLLKRKADIAKRRGS